MLFTSKSSSAPPRSPSAPRARGTGGSAAGGRGRPGARNRPRCGPRPEAGPPSATGDRGRRAAGCSASGLCSWDPPVSGARAAEWRRARFRCRAHYANVRVNCQPLCRELVAVMRRPPAGRPSSQRTGGGTCRGGCSRHACRPRPC